MEPLVSILIPAYNAERWIADTLASALNQTWRRIEIIVVDDGSTDQTRAVAERFVARNVAVLTTPNLRAAAARNRAYAACQGDYIQWLDADDLLGPDKIRRQLEARERAGSKRKLLSSAWGRFMYRPAKAQFVPSPLWEDLTPVEWLLRKLGQNLYMQTSTWLVSRELAEAAGPWDTRLTLDDDGEYFCRVLLASEGTHFVPDAPVYYRAAGFSSLSSVLGFAEKLDSQFLSMQRHIEYLRSLEDSPRVRAACLQYLRTWLPLAYPERPEIVRGMEALAVSLGERLELPQLAGKYAWIQKGFGWAAAKRAQACLPKVKWSLVRFWDKALFEWEGRKSSLASPGL